MSFLSRLKEGLHERLLQKDREIQGEEYMARLAQCLGIPDTVDTIDITFNYDDGKFLAMRIGRVDEIRSDSSSDEK